MKAAIVGSRTFSDEMMIRDCVNQLQEKYGDTLVIVSGGAKDGADAYAKKYAIFFGVEYHEYNPAHTRKNQYSIMPPGYFGKEYHVSHFFHRNTLIVKNSDVVLAFINPHTKSTGTEHTIKEAEKFEKSILIYKQM
ncbi:MAG: DUF2493 domain-containing protein [Bacteroidetes bacterium]|nr:DUF2493 domain-containing protein [Bacteroidota bacterium]